jgi:ABC-type sugar transport system ATPase subunit
VISPGASAPFGLAHGPKHPSAPFTTPGQLSNRHFWYISSPPPIGVAGLEGSGKNKLAECIVGARKFERGELSLFGKRYVPRGTGTYISRGIRYVPLERRWDGIIPVESVAYNIGLSNFDRFKKGLFVSGGLLNKAAGKSVKEMKIKTSSIQQVILDLSGGNQQKLVFSRVLVGDPRILILSEPTRGIDVGTKYEIYLLMQRLAAGGMSILFISSEMAELLALSDRVLALYKGVLKGEFDPQVHTQEDLLDTIMGRDGSGQPVFAVG